MTMLNHATFRVLIAACLGILCAPVLADGDPQAGKDKAKVCAACHDPSGKIIDPTYPILAGQHESYLVKSLADYRAGRRNNAVMQPMAANLSDQDIEDLAAFYASLEGLKDLSIR